MTNDPRALPLAGVKVLDFSRVLAGPWSAMVLADFGADVIKIEHPARGDDTRDWGLRIGDTETTYFNSVNRSKRSICVDLQTEAGRRIARELAAQADVLIHNFKAGGAEKLGLGYDALAAVNPGLIYCSISGYGRTGPWADKGGFDLIAQGFAGLMSITGEPGRPPVKSGSPVADINAGILAALGIVAAYAHRQRTGVGQVVDTSLMEAALQQTYWQAASWFATGRSPGPTGSAHLLTAPYQAFRTADGWLNIGGANQANWERIADVLGHPEWRADPRFVANADRMRNLDALVEAMNATLVTRTTAEWMERFDQAGVPAGAVHSIGEALEHPQTLARDMVVSLDHREAGPTRALGCPVHFSRTPTRVDRPAPALGEHTRAVLHEFGYDDAFIDALVHDGVVAAPTP